MKKKAVIIADSSNIRVSMSKNFGPESRFSYPKFEGLYSQECYFVKKFISGSRNKSGDGFWATIERYNYIVKTYEPKLDFGDGSKREKQVDSSLVADGTEAIINHKPDLLIILSGDADMIPLVDKARLYGVETHVWACKGSVSTSLRQAADHMYFIDDYIDADLVYFQHGFRRTENFDKYNALFAQSRANGDRRAGAGYQPARASGYAANESKPSAYEEHPKAKPAKIRKTVRKSRRPSWKAICVALVVLALLFAVTYGYIARKRGQGR